MSRSRKLGPASGDFELRNAIYNIPTSSTRRSVVRTNEISTASEPRNTGRHRYIIPEIGPHRQSQPNVWVGDMLINDQNMISSSSHRLSNEPSIFGENRQNMDIPPATLITSRSLNNSFLDTNETSLAIFDNLLSDQQNNNKPVNEPYLRPGSHHVKFANDKSKVIHSKQYSLTPNSINNFEIENIKQFKDTDLVAASLPVCSTEASKPIQKSIAFRRARIICLFSLICALTCIAVEIIFLVSVVLANYKCSSISAFVGKLVFLISLIVCLELVRFCLWREPDPSKLGLYDERTFDVHAQISMLASSLHMPNNDSTNPSFNLSHNEGAKDALNHPDLDVNQHAERAFSIKSNSIDWKRSQRCLDSKQFSLTVILTVCYLSMFGFLVSGFTWIPSNYKSSLHKLNVATNTTQSTDAQMCTQSTFYAGLVYLVLHSIIIVARVLCCCLGSYGSIGRCIITRARGNPLRTNLESIDSHLPSFECKDTSNDEQCTNFK